MPATLSDVEAIIARLPAVTEGTRFRNRTWFVGTKGFAWERPLSKADIKRLGDEPVPDGEILAVMVEDLHEKEAVLAENRPGFFTIEHFENYPAVLIQLRKVRKRDLRIAIEDAWLVLAPEPMARSYLDRSR